MAYIGNQPGTGVRSRFIFTATASQTTFSGADDNSKTLKYADSAYVDVFLNGICLVPGTDYTASTKTSIVLTQAASLNDTLEVVAYDIASMDDSISAADGGTFQSDVTFADGADIITASAGTDNVRIGENAGDSIASGGNDNTVVGKNAGTAITTGDHNTAVGHDALDAMTTSSYNTAIGSNAATAVTTGQRNTALGYGSLQTDTLGSRATALGFNALGTQNFTSATNNYNVGVGYDAGGAITDGVENTIVGSLAGDAVTDGTGNVIMGYAAGGAATTTDHSVLIGYEAGGTGTLTGHDNVFIGMRAGKTGTSVNSSIAIGREALSSITTGVDNVCIGMDAGKALVNGNYNTAVGTDALVTEDGHGKNVAIGWSTLKNLNSGVTGLDGQNVAVGYDAGRNTNLGVYNTFVGSEAGQANTAGDANTFIGRNSGSTVTTGDNNTILGPFDGNQDSLDIRTSDHNIVLSSGDGSVRFYYVGSGNYWNLGTRNGNVAGNNQSGMNFYDSGFLGISRDGGTVFKVNRKQDGTLVEFMSQGATEGTVSISGSTTSYNGGHLSRWSRLESDNKDTSIVKGTVMTNLDKMVVWHHEAIEAQDAVRNEKGNIVTEAVEAKDAWTEDNEQLNCMAVSSVEGDPNVAGVFVNWDDDDDFNDMNVAMTGDMVIRIAQGVTVARGDLLMSAGDGTAKPQGDDIVRSKTIAKVTSTNVSHTYDDGSFLVPCVLMAC